MERDLRSQFDRTDRTSGRELRLHLFPSLSLEAGNFSGIFITATGQADDQMLRG
jgi:hypothetical protein